MLVTENTESNTTGNPAGENEQPVAQSSAPLIATGMTVSLLGTLLAVIGVNQYFDSLLRPYSTPSAGMLAFAGLISLAGQVTLIIGVYRAAKNLDGISRKLLS